MQVLGDYIMSLLYVQKKIADGLEQDGYNTSDTENTGKH